MNLTFCREAGIRGQHNDTPNACCSLLSKHFVETLQSSSSVLWVRGKVQIQFQAAAVCRCLDTFKTLSSGLTDALDCTCEVGTALHVAVLHRCTAQMFLL